MVTRITSYETGDPAFAVDRDGVIVLWNEAAEITLGYPATTALGQKCWELLCGQDTYGNEYCCERCLLREMAFQHKSVNGFKAVYKTFHEGRKSFVISCLTVFDDPGNELLLHICRADEQTRETTGRRSRFKSSTRSYRGVLSPRELEALELLANGKNNHEISSVMYISIPTVRNHIQHLLHKLDVHSRLEAVLVARQHGLVKFSKPGQRAARKNR